MHPNYEIKTFYDGAYFTYEAWLNGEVIYSETSLERLYDLITYDRHKKGNK